MIRNPKIGISFAMAVLNHDIDRLISDVTSSARHLVDGQESFDTKRFLYSTVP